MKLPAPVISMSFSIAPSCLSLFAAEKPQACPPNLHRPLIGPKKMVEHTSINPNKAAHIGHVRNAVLGDTFVRILQAADERVEVQNYIDNTGVQVADVVVGFMHIEKMNLDDIKALDSSLPADRPFDYYCWDLYTQGRTLLSRRRRGGRTRIRSV